MPSKVAFIFPGQGSQKVGMGREAYDSSEAARAIFDQADAALGESLSELCFEGPEDALKLTRNTQPAILTNSIALLRGLGLDADCYAGHSLGEYSAHVAAGTLSFEEAVQTVRARGEYMQEAVPVGQGAMSAVLKLSDEQVVAICESTDGLVTPANYNAPGQVVIAGELEAVKRAGDAVKEAGGRAIALPVSAPFHCAMMAPAEEALAATLAVLNLKDPKVPVYANVSASLLTSAEQARDALIRQVSRPVRWRESVEKMVADGVRLFVEIGEGSALRGMLRRTTKDALVINVQKAADFEGVREKIAEIRKA